MIAFEDYKDANGEVKQVGSQYFVYVCGERIGIFDDQLEAEDELYNALRQAVEDDHAYVCEFCNIFCVEADVKHRIADETFTAPYGDTIVIGGDVSSVAVCPVCGRDLEVI